MVKLLLKLIWFSFGAFGLVTVGQKYWPEIQNSDLVKGVQGSLIVDEESKLGVDPAATGQAFGQVVQKEITKIIETNTETIKALPQKEVEKIKIDICNKIMDL